MPWYIHGIGHVTSCQTTRHHKVQALLRDRADPNGLSKTSVPLLLEASSAWPQVKMAKTILSIQFVEVAWKVPSKVWGIVRIRSSRIQDDSSESVNTSRTHQTYIGWVSPVLKNQLIDHRISLVVHHWVPWSANWLGIRGPKRWADQAAQALTWLHCCRNLSFSWNNMLQIMLPSFPMTRVVVECSG